MKETIEKIKEENIKGVYGTLKELFESKDKHLILTLLQLKQDYIVVEDEKVAYRVIEFLKKQKSCCRTTFIPLNNIKVAPKHLSKPKIDGVIDYAINMIKFDEKYKNAFYFALGKILIVKNNNAAKKLIDKCPNKYHIATLDGAIYEKSGKVIYRPAIKVVAHLESRGNLVPLNNLEESTIAWSLELINRKTNKEISDIINLSKAEIKAMVDNFDIQENETLVCEIQNGTKLTEREEEFFTLIKQGKNISEISKTLMVSRTRVKTVVKIILAKILIGLYDYYNAECSYVSELAHPVLEGMRYYGFMYGKASGKIDGYWYEFDEKGKVHLKIKCDNFERVDKDCIIISIDKKYGLIDNCGNYLITPKYEELKKTFGETRSLFTAKLNKKYGVIDEHGETIIDFKYDNMKFFGDKEHICAKNQGKWGLINVNENIIVPFIYDESFNIYALPFRENEGFIVEKEGKEGVINLESKVIIPFEYDCLCSNFFDTTKSLTVAQKNGKCGVINSKNETLIPFEYEHIEIFSNETMFVHNFNKGYIIDFSNKKVCDKDFQFINSEGNGEYFCAMKNDKSGLIGKFGNIKIDFKYDDLFFINKNLLVANKNSKEGIIDVNENIIVPFKYWFKREKCLDKDNTLPARRRIKGKLKWGLINLQDEVLIDFKFDILMPFNDRKYTLAIVNNKWMYVNKKGEILKIDIDNYVTK